MRDSNCKNEIMKRAYSVTILGDTGKMLTVPRIKGKNKKVSDYISR
jgi:hypothetical protein